MKNAYFLLQKTFIVKCFFLASLFFSTTLVAQPICLDFSNVYVQEASLGSPLTGPFAPNEELLIKVEIGWTGDGCNWFHGLVPTFGNGWSDASFNENGEVIAFNPPQDYGRQGDFYWYSNGEVTYKSPFSELYMEGEIMPPGWFVTNTTQASSNTGCVGGEYVYNPNCSCGFSQGCSFVEFIELSFTLTTASEADCFAGQNDLSISFLPFSDAETGASVSQTCFDTPEFGANWELDCEANLALRILPEDVFIENNSFVDIDLRDYLYQPDPNITFTWEAYMSNHVDGASSCEEDCGDNIYQNLTNSYDQIPSSSRSARYIVTAINEFGEEGYPAEFKVNVYSDFKISLDLYEDGPLCPDDCTTLYSRSYGSGYQNSSYQWGHTENDFSYVQVCPSETTNYTITITDGFGNELVDNVEVEIHPGNTEILSNISPPPLCHDFSPNSLSFATDIIDYELVWLDPNGDAIEEGVEEIFPTLSGDYTLSITDLNNGCNKELSMAVVENEPVEVFLFTLENEVCLGADPVILSYQPANGELDGNVNAEGLFVPDELGEQIVSYTINTPNNCEYVKTVTINVVDCSVVDVKDISKNNIRISPNPTNHLLNLESSKSMKFVQLYDVLGRLVLEQNINGVNFYQLDLTELEIGIYQLVVDGVGLEKVVVI